MTDNEIIKALERCGQHRECCYCNSVEECGNKRVLTASALDLINRQKAEIERLQKNNEYILMQHKFDRRPNGDCWNDVIEKAKSEAIKEFAEKLKEKYGEADILCPRRIVSLTENTLDNLVKETVGDAE